MACGSNKDQMDHFPRIHLPLFRDTYPYDPPTQRDTYILRDLQCIRDLRITAGYILEHVKINCGFEIWHINPTCSPHSFKGAIF